MEERKCQITQAIDAIADEIGTLAVKLLIRAIREPGAAPSHLPLPPSLVIRRSVRNLLL